MPGSPDHRRRCPGRRLGGGEQRGDRLHAVELFLVEPYPR